MNAFFERIDPAIKESGLSAAEIERRCGIPPKTISKWRHTALKSYVDYVQALSAVLGKPTWYLLGEDKPAPTNEDGLSEKQIELIQLIRSMSPLEVDLLLAQARIEIARRKSQD